MACKGTFLLIIVLAAALVAGCNNEPKIGGVEIKKICDTWAKEALDHMRLAAEGKIEFNPEEANRRVVIISALGSIALAQALA
jgi:hypothetical protein